MRDFNNLYAEQRARRARGAKELFNCPYCGGEIYEGDQVFSPDGENLICIFCFKEYVEDLSVDEFCEVFGVNSEIAGENAWR